VATLINRLLARLGYRYYKIRYQPFGIDHALDVRRFSEPNDRVSVVFDVGANEGQSAKMYAEQFPEAIVYSFEPVATTFAKLVANTRDCEHVKAFQIGFGDEVAELDIWLSDKSVTNSLKCQTSANSSGRTERVRVTTLDTFVTERCVERIDLLKVDTEGFDLEVLRGARNMLAAGRITFILVEITFNQQDTFHTPFYPVEAYLDQFGFEFVDLYDQDYASYSPRRPPLAYCNALFYHSRPGSSRGFR
jgi:FkbM family methyltransferase